MIVLAQSFYEMAGRMHRANAHRANPCEAVSPHLKYELASEMAALADAMGLGGLR